jgi:hypothetical protein
MGMTDATARSRLDITIDLLVLTEIPRIARDAVVSAFHAELSRLARAPNREFGESRATSAIALSFETTGPDDGPDVIGTAAARQLFKCLGAPNGVWPGLGGATNQ